MPEHSETIANIQSRLQTFSDEYQALQQDLQKNVSVRQGLEAQQQENQGVLKEFQGLEDDANIYKLVGPVLLEQERTEANLAVEGRLEFIGKEIQRVDGVIDDMQEKGEKKKMQIFQLQNEAQQLNAEASTAAGKAQAPS